MVPARTFVTVALTEIDVELSADGTKAMNGSAYSIVAAGGGCVLCAESTVNPTLTVALAAGDPLHAVALRSQTRACATLSPAVVALTSSWISTALGSASP
jgi:hypothetical protein